jgi:hypothetical protein
VDEWSRLSFPVEEEGTASRLHGQHGVIARHGLFWIFDTDNGSHYF